MGHNVLTSKQEEFAQCVFKGSTYSDAYRQAYNVGEKTLKTSIWRLSSAVMDNIKVSSRVDELRAGVTKRNDISVDNVLEQLGNWLMADPINAMDDDGCVKALSLMDKSTRMSISEIQVTEIWGMIPNIDGKNEKTKTGEIKRIKFVDKRGTAEMWMKKFGQFIPEGSSIADNLDAIREIINTVKGK